MIALNQDLEYSISSLMWDDNKESLSRNSLVPRLAETLFRG